MMPSVIPNGKTIRKQYFIRRRARSLHQSRTPTIQVLTAAERRTVHLDWRLPKCEINTH